MLRLIQSLGSHSITAAELKLLLRLMRDTQGEEVIFLNCQKISNYYFESSTLIDQ